MGKNGDGVVIDFLLNAVAFGLAASVAFEWNRRWEKIRPVNVVEVFVVGAGTAFLAYLFLHVTLGFRL